MDQTPRFDQLPDKVSFPGGYDFIDIGMAVKLAALRHTDHVPFAPVQQVMMQKFLEGLAERNPEEPLPFEDPYQLRGRELMARRRGLLHSHLELTWFSLAYWAYGLLAVRSGFSVAVHDGLGMFVEPVRLALWELGVRASDDECLAEADRFLPEKPTAQSVEHATHLFLAFVRFLHRGALRRRQVVGLGLSLPGVCLAFADADADEARAISTFLTTHGVPIIQRPAEIGATDRLLVLLSRQSMDSEGFWRVLADCQHRQVVPMVLCLMPRAELYREPASQRSHHALWAWLAANVAVERTTETDRYQQLLRALDLSDPKQWWWTKGDAVELGLAVDILDAGIPRPITRRAGGAPGGPYPFAFDPNLVFACLVASEQGGGSVSQRDARYIAMCLDLEVMRLKPNGRPYELPWFVLIYRAWTLFASHLPAYGRSQQDLLRMGRELQVALFALGIGTGPDQAAAFLEDFAKLPWNTDPSTLAGVDQRTIAFVVLAHHLCQSAIARTQRMRLEHPGCSAFISYARPDESFARELAAHLEAKGADVWWDLNSITLGVPLQGTLRSAVGSAAVLFLVATPAADASSFVRQEVEAAIAHGLRIVRLSPPGDAEMLTSALAHLQRPRAEQVGWLQSQELYRPLLDHLAQARAARAEGRAL